MLRGTADVIWVTESLDIRCKCKSLHSRGPLTSSSDQRIPVRWPANRRADWIEINDAAMCSGLCSVSGGWL
jgi:hypothetical protein